MLRRGPESISPTAHYTGAVWARHGLSDPAFATPEGRVLLEALRPATIATRLLGGPSLEGFLLARHRIIDDRLAAAIEAGEVGQVVELAAGLSPRGWRVSREHGDTVTYVEADLPGMAARKRRALERAGADVRVVDLDVFADGDALQALAATLDRDAGVAVITEGLLNYFDRRRVLALWGRLVKVFSPFPGLLYLSDLVIRSGTPTVPAALFSAALQAFVRGRVHVHFSEEAEVLAALEGSGFASAELHRPADPAAQLVRVIEARA